MDPVSTSPNAPAQVNLQTLVAAIQNAVQAQNLIATNIKGLTAEQTSFFTSFLAAFSTAFPTPLSSSVVWDPSNLANGASETTTVTVAGAALGNYVQVSFSLDLQGLTLTGYVSAANTVTVVLSNATGGAINLASGMVKVRVTTQ
jgi:hypothetical protein